MRVKSPAQRRHRQLLQRTKGYRMTKNRLVKAGSEAVLHAGQYAYIGRKLRKRQLRRLWITRLNIAVRQGGLTYGTFISGMKRAHLAVDRKILADIAVRDPQTFTQLIDKIKQTL
jgi:large subunit ribosomal protein L20